MKNISVCLATCNRNDLLDKCLESVSLSIGFLESKYNVSVVVVDNNDVETAKEIVDKYKDKMNVFFAWESKKGIPFARNKCLEISRDLNSDFIVFIDDDEVVAENWLFELVDFISTSGCDVASGKVIQNGMSKIKHGTDYRDRAETDNVIIKRWIIEKLSFDEEMAQTGGTDTLFFRQAFKLGAVIRYCESAVVTETFTEDREHFSWILKRNFRYGLVNCLIEEKLNKKKKYTLFVKGVSQISVGFLGVLYSCIFFNRKQFELSRNRIMRGLGGCSYFFKVRYYEYARS